MAISYISNISIGISIERSHLIHLDVVEGVSSAATLRRHTSIFPAYYISILNPSKRINFALACI